MKIEALPPGQVALLLGCRDERLRIERNTAPADRDRAEAAISDLYLHEGKPVPAFLWTDSPLSAVLAVAALQQRGEAAAGRYESSGELYFSPGSGLPTDWLGSRAYRQVDAALGCCERWAPTVRAGVEAEIRQMLSTLPGERARPGAEALRARRWERLEEQLVDLLGDNGIRHRLEEPYFRTQVCRLALYGLGMVDPGWLDEPWLGRMDLCSWPVDIFCREILGVRYTDRASRFMDLSLRIARSCGWFWPREDICIVSERPEVVHRDNGERLHHPAAAAAAFRDGFEVHAWHGTLVPWWWIMTPGEIPPSLALSSGNVEQRHAAAEIIGWERVLQLLETRLIDKDEDPAIGDLIEVTLPVPDRWVDRAMIEGLEVARLVPGDGTARFLRVRRGTGRNFALSVPRETRTALEARAWTYGMKPEEYALEAPTCMEVKRIAAQGDVLFRRIPELPEDAVEQRSHGRIVVVHSDMGHHHAIAGPGVRLFEELERDPTVCFLRVDAAFADVVHLRPHAAHETLRLERGVWEVRRQRAWRPEGWAPVCY